MDEAILCDEVDDAIPNKVMGKRWVTETGQTKADRFETCIATGKSFVASAGKKTSTAFLVYWGAFWAWSISTICSFAPVSVLFAKANNFVSTPDPSILMFAKAAACPSMGWETFLSVE